MAKSAIYIVQPGPIDLVDGDTIPLGTTVRRFGQNIRQDGNSVTLCNKSCYGGYYTVDVTANLESAAAAPVTVSLLKDGVEILGGKMTVTLPAVTLVPFPISVIIKDTCGTANLSVVVNGADTKLVNMTTRVVKL